MRRVALRCSTVLLVLGLAYTTWRAGLEGSFQYDDWPNLVRDSATSDAEALRARLLRGIRPLLRLSYFLDQAAWGLEPRGFLRTHLVLHLLTTLGVWALARRRLSGALGPLAAAAAFAVQPAHAETLCYVSGRSTGLMAALLVAALLAHERAALARGHARLGWHCASLTSFVAACLAKEVGLVYPLLLALWEGTRPGAPGAREGPRLLVRRVLPAAGMALVLLALFALVPRYRVLWDFSASLRGPLDNLAVNARAVPTLLSLWLTPWALGLEHPLDVGPGHLAASLAGGALLATLLGAGLLLRRRAPGVALALLWPLVALLPTHSLVSKLDPVTEKPLYLAWVGPALALGVLAERASRLARPEARAAAALAGLLTLGWGAAWSAHRAAVWANPVRLWEEASARAPRSARAWNNLGMARLGQGDAEGAALAFQQALYCNPRHLEARDNLRHLELIHGRGPLREMGRDDGAGARSAGVRGGSQGAAL